ncbi:alternative ribosome rescue aminoacyl-tRNA hydrolase ArfB [Acidithrix sp. C25]|jgi:ribosome-associated protein|uniref:alternative ribosome rescue aminoacyl-tRNA hydrolase ArfB n=1 Tax=Acidithrix sp. C25 TaxID=1671482 RepID=UPI000B14A1AE|nr:alternative ribosome rescue aminoacyl-tRNA hydrolase ArfB [Acidithrix sp. C25]CAG4911617.1 unnamed protein product [Acidithrix sp. C25]
MALSPKITVPTSSLTWRFSRSSGAGGQHVNTTDSRVELICDLSGIYCSSVNRDLIMRRYGDSIRVVSSTQRSQGQNRKIALDRLHELLENACKTPKIRKPTRPTRGANQARLDDKRALSNKKLQRAINVDE